MIPVPVLKHSLIIHRRGMRARLWRSVFFTDPPPSSERAAINNGSTVRESTGTYHSECQRRIPRCQSPTHSRNSLALHNREPLQDFPLLQSYEGYSRCHPYYVQEPWYLSHRSWFSCRCDTVLVERQRMTGVQNNIVRAVKRHVPHDQPGRVRGVPAGRYEVGDRWTGRTTYHIPRNLTSTSKQKVCLNCALNC